MRKVRGEFVDRNASFMHRQELGYLVSGQTGLHLTERWDGSMGRSVTSLTRENAVQTRHVVGVGITVRSPPLPSSYQHRDAQRPSASGAASRPPVGSQRPTLLHRGAGCTTSPWYENPASFYVNVDGLPEDVTSGLAGLGGRCAVGDTRCRSYNYGRNAVTYDRGYAKAFGISSPIWWLDVEMEPIWRVDPASNSEVIRGVIDGFRSRGHRVGIYSTQFQWGVITGGYNPGTPPVPTPKRR